jgi:NADH-quinone oxidoreductase subunit H
MITIKGYLLGLAMVFCAFVFQTSIGGITRKTIARIQKRRGPVWYQNFIDINKLFNKSSISHGWIFDLGVMLSLGTAIGTAMFIPVAGLAPFKGFDNFFMIAYLAALGMIGRTMGAVASGNPLASIGVMRMLVQAVGQKVPYMMVVLSVISLSRISSLSAIVEIQQTNGWNVLAMPFGSFVALISLHAALGMKPFDTPYAPAEIASGAMVEYGGKQLAMLTIAGNIAAFVEVGLFVDIFLGGGASLAGFALKYFVVYTLLSSVNAVLGRFKVDQVVTFFYKVPIALSLVHIAMIKIFNTGV